MQRRVNWAARALGFVWIGLFTFLIAPPHGSLAWAVQIAGYGVAGAGLVGGLLAAFRARNTMDTRVKRN